MNFLQKFLAIAVPGALISAPAFAHGGGLLILYIGLPLLVVLFLFFLSWSLYIALAGTRLNAFIESLFIGVLWLFIFVTPLFLNQMKIVIRSYEEIWAIAVPLLLLVGSWGLHKRPKKNNT